MNILAVSLANFEFFLAKRKIKTSTLNGHLDNAQRTFKKVNPFTYNGFLAYLLGLKKQGRRGRYLNIIVHTFKLWGQFTNNEDFKKLEDFPEEPFIKATMSDEEIEALLTLPKSFNVKQDDWNRWTLFFSIMAYTGMRPSEVATLTIDQCDFGRSIFILEDTKTGSRFVPIPPNLTKELQDYITRLPAKYLFPSKRNGKYKGNYVDSVDWGYNFHSRITRLGIKRKNLTPYSLRHSLITRLLEEDVNIFKVQKIVGHRRLDTTAQYTHLTTKDIQQAITKHPLIRRSTSPLDILQALDETIKSFNLEKDKRFSYNLEQGNNFLRIEVIVK